MIEIGKINTLKVTRRVGSEIYLSCPTSANILLVDKKPSASLQVGDVLTVFVYVDMEGHLAATTTIPKALADEIAWLEVISINKVGAFLDWGLQKDLLIPFGEQHYKLEVGDFCMVKLFLDHQNRILATTKIDPFIAEENLHFKEGQTVNLLIADKTDLGFKAIINHTHWGMLYQNELFRAIERGQQLSGFIKRIREDNKIDLSLYPAGYVKVDELTDKILSALKNNHGFLPLSDKSPPESIYRAFGISKKTYKQAIGALYKNKQIIIEKTGIRLV